MASTKYPRRGGPPSAPTPTFTPEPFVLKHKHGKPWLRAHPKEVEQALFDNYGILSKAAQQLECSPVTLKQLIAKHPPYQEMKELARETRNDLVEFALLQKALKDGHPAALIYYTKAQMGWREEDRREAAAPVQINLTWNDGSEKPEITQAEHEPVQEIESVQIAE